MLCLGCSPFPNCTIPPAPNNGSIGVSTVKACCDYGFDLIESEYRTCTHLDEWDGVAPYCERKYMPSNNNVLIITFVFYNEKSFHLIFFLFRRYVQPCQLMTWWTIYVTLNTKWNNWTMNIEKNVTYHTRITNDKFRTNKIQNSRKVTIFNCFFLSFCMLANLSNSAFSYFT